MSVLVGLIALGGIAGCVVAWRRWRVMRRELARVRATFSRYVAPSVVDVLLARKDERLFTGRAVRATILVCRIRNFAHFIEPLTPEETLRYLNEFYGLAGTAVQRHRGIIESFLGDGIVAVFGVPLDNPTQEEDALQAALDVVRHVVGMRERWAKQHRKPFTVGIGINTGDVIAGDAGFRERREFTVVGSEATMAHRLQEAAFVLNAYIVASRSTCASHVDDYHLVPVNGVPLAGVRRMLDAFVVRGRHRSVESFTVPVDALVETTIETPPVMPPPAPVPAPSAAVPPKAAAKLATAKPGATDTELPVARPRAATATQAPDLGLPQLERGWMFPQDDDVRPILPDPPPRRATYEDGGPPLDY